MNNNSLLNYSLRIGIGLSKTQIIALERPIITDYAVLAFEN